LEFVIDSHQFDQLSRHLARVTALTPRRTLLQGAAALGTALGGSALWASASNARKKNKRKNKNKNKNKRKNERKKGLCRTNGTTCGKKSKSCQAQNCLNTPFTIEAVWTSDSDHDTFVFVPNEAGGNLPSPFINFACNGSGCELDVYPFICVSEDATGPGDEVTTVRQVIPGTYEYWIELESQIPAGDLTVTLRRSNGSVVQSWSSPENASIDQRGWHVFDINGQTKSITSFDQLIDDDLPEGAHDPNTNVCP
jgi:hypothetical protein